MITHDMIVTMATVFSVLPDAWSLVLMGGELVLNGDGSYITGIELGKRIY